MPTPAPSPSAAALSAFLRGIERRARVFAQAQSGSAEVADAATATAIEAFRQQAGQLPLRQWPLRFWAELLTVPALTRAEVVPPAMPALQPLYRLAPGPRAALLLRMAAGLDVAHVAEVLGVSEKAARLALARAVKDFESGVGDTRDAQDTARGAERLRALDQALQAQVRAAPAPCTPTASAAGDAPGRPARAPSTPPAPREARLRRALWAALALVAVMFGATYLLWPSEPPLAVGELRALPAVSAPGAGAILMSPAASALASPDFDLLADPEGSAFAGDLGFLSWLAAETVGEPLPPETPSR